MEITWTNFVDFIHTIYYKQSVDSEWVNVLLVYTSSQLADSVKSEAQWMISMSVVIEH